MYVAEQRYFKAAKLRRQPRQRDLRLVDARQPLSLICPVDRNGNGYHGQYKSRPRRGRQTRRSRQEYPCQSEDYHQNIFQQREYKEQFDEPPGKLGREEAASDADEELLLERGGAEDGE